MPLRHPLALLPLLALGGCAAAVPGYQPPNPTLERFRAATPTGGGFDADGTYRLTDQERELDCRRLTGSMTIKILQMRDSANRLRPSAAATAAQAAARPLVGGPTYGQSIEDDLRRDRARLEALNRQLAAKNCPTFDLDAQLRPDNADPPRTLTAVRETP